MEKIKDAIAKVKLEKTATNKKNESGLVRAKKTNVKPAVTKVQSDISHIEYDVSRVVKLDPSHLEKHRIVAHLNHNANAAVFDSLRTQILQKMEENNWKTLAIVSPNPESGKSMVSINLAISMAHQPQKSVLLADFDLRKPKIASYLGIEGKSLNEYLEGDIDLSDVLVNPGIQRLVVLPTMQPVHRASDALSSSKVRELIQELKDRYESRIIIFDLPPILGVDDAMVVLPQADCILMVVANGISTPEEIHDSLQLLPKENLLGIVYNKADEENKAYYY